ncbi:MAG: hypothetical protein EOM23_00225 [Candidatus Moranbacteria bacterium]|nr:hypothetical protein [Candidatus Moranbacteria bacterium]
MEIIPTNELAKCLNVSISTIYKYYAEYSDYFNIVPYDNGLAIEGDRIKTFKKIDIIRKLKAHRKNKRVILAELNNFCSTNSDELQIKESMVENHSYEPSLGQIIDDNKLLGQIIDDNKLLNKKIDVLWEEILHLKTMMHEITQTGK